MKTKSKVGKSTPMPKMDAMIGDTPGGHMMPTGGTANGRKSTVKKGGRKRGK